MEITYEKLDDYYIFSDAPKTRVYLGDADPQDYIHDQLEQVKRSASCYYYVIATGEKVDGYPKGEIAGSFSATVSYKCDYDFVRKLSLSQWGGRDRNCKINMEDPAMQRLGEAYYFNQTVEQWDESKAKFKAERDAWDAKFPSLKNLVWADGEMYYRDAAGNKLPDKELDMVTISKEIGESLNGI